METLFDPESPQHFTARIASLTAESQPLWGKMNVQEMLAHTLSATEIALGTKPMSRSILGRLLGRIGKRLVIDSRKPFAKNGPTDPRLVFSVETVSAEKVEEEKAKLIAAAVEFHRRGPAGTPKDPHPFFGKLTSDEWDRLSAKHIDHHLRQFGA